MKRSWGNQVGFMRVEMQHSVSYDDSGPDPKSTEVNRERSTDFCRLWIKTLVKACESMIFQM